MSLIYIFNYFNIYVIFYVPRDQQKARELGLGGDTTKIMSMSMDEFNVSDMT